MQPSDDDIVRLAVRFDFVHEPWAGALVNGYIDGHNYRDKVIAFARALLAEAQRAAVPQWVACSERMPERNPGSMFTPAVWVYRASLKRVDQAFHDGDVWWVGDMAGAIDDVTHWCPRVVPQPPKETQG